MGELKVWDGTGLWKIAQDSNWATTTDVAVSQAGTFHYDGEIQYVTDRYGFTTRDAPDPQFEYLMHASGGRPYIGRYKSADQTITTGTVTPVTFGSTLDGTGLQGFTTSDSSLFTVPYAGIYQINAQLSWGTTATSGRGQILVDNFLTHLISGAIPLSTAPTNNAINVSGVFKMYLGDTLQVFAYQNSTANLVVTGGLQNTQLTAVYLGSGPND